MAAAALSLWGMIVVDAEDRRVAGLVWQLERMLRVDPAGEESFILNLTAPVEPAEALREVHYLVYMPYFGRCPMKAKPWASAAAAQGIQAGEPRNFLASIPPTVAGGGIFIGQPMRPPDGSDVCRPQASESSTRLRLRCPGPGPATGGRQGGSVPAQTASSVKPRAIARWPARSIAQV